MGAYDIEYMMRFTIALCQSSEGFLADEQEIFEIRWSQRGESNEKSYYLFDRNFVNNV